jgi:hypothetical protein
MDLQAAATMVLSALAEYPSHHHPYWDRATEILQILDSHHQKYLQARLFSLTYQQYSVPMSSSYSKG